MTTELPDLGVGVMWFPALGELIDHADAIDFLEFEPAVGSVGSGHVSARVPAGTKPVVVHGVTCAVGGSVPPDPADVAELARVAAVVDSPWVSEHLSISKLRLTGLGNVHAGFLLPPAQTEDAVAVAARNLGLLQAAVGRPIAFETGVNYFRPQRGHMSDGDFFAAVAEEAGCFILCDLHNLWCNEQNGRQKVVDVVDALPAERVCEMHLAGGYEHRGFLLDAHSGAVDPELVDLAVDVAQRLPALRAVTYELMPDYVGPQGIDDEVFGEQIRCLRRVWDARGGAPEPPRARRSEPARGEATTSGRWEGALASAVAAGTPSGVLAGDPAVPVYRELIDTVRRGNLVTALPLSYRLLALTLDVQRADELIAEYTAATPPEAWAHDEAGQFREFVASSAPECPHLLSVIDFELGACRAVLTHERVRVRFDCEPAELIDALRRGVRPRPQAGEYEVVIDP